MIVAMSVSTHRPPSLGARRASGVARALERRTARLAAPALASLATLLDAASAAAQAVVDVAAEVRAAPAGMWTRERIPPGWSLIESRSFQLQSRLDAELTSLLGRHLEGLLSLYRDLLPSAARSERLVVKLLADEDEYLAYAPTKSRYGRYDAEAGEVVVWNTRLVLGESELSGTIKLAPDRVHTLTFGENQAVLHYLDEATRAATPDLAETLAQWTWRQYLHRRVWPKHGPPELPAWLEQGLAEHFAGAQPAARGDPKIGLNAARVRELGWLLVEGDVRPLGQLLLPADDAAPFDVGPGPRAQGWALVHYLLAAGPEEWRPLLPQLLQEAGRTRDFRAAAATALASLDLERLQSEWTAWAQGLRVADPLADLAREFGGKIRPEQLSGDDELEKRYGWLWRRRDGPQPGGAR